MKKILFLLLVTISSYGQTLQNPTFGTITTKTNTEDNTATKVLVQDATGKLNWVNKTVFPLDANVIHTTGNETKTGNLTANNFVLPAQSLGTSTYSFNGVMASTDTFSMYGTDGGADAGIFVFKVGDNGVPFASGGQKFSFRYDATFSGVAKTPFEIDYNDITANAIINANFNINSNANIISNGIIFTDSVRPNTGNNLTLLNGGSNMLLVDGSARITSLSGSVSEIVVADASGNLIKGGVAPTSGAYTPTLTGTNNVSSVTIQGVPTYSRVGNIVTVSIGVNVSPTLGASTLTSFTATLPVTRGVATPYNVGSASLYNGSTAIVPGYVQATSATVVTCIFFPLSVTAVSGTLTFQYQI